MDRIKCKLCSKSFTSGKALGGHMRTHLATLRIPPKTPAPAPAPAPPQLSDPIGSTSSLSSSSEERESEEKMLVYGLRENPKKSFKVVDPKFLDRESETESTRNPTRKRSKLTRKVGFEEEEAENNEKKPKLRKPSSTQSISELEPVSSVSNTSPEESVALCLMMLSRDVWMCNNSDELKLSQRTRGKYKCETSNKLVRSCQALGGQRTSHEGESTQPRTRGFKNVDQKVYECTLCGKVFGSGQALGGHKRSHLLGSSITSSKCDKIGENLAEVKCVKYGDGFIDLNMPAPMEDEDFSQLDDEFINLSSTDTIDT